MGAAVVAQAGSGCEHVALWARDAGLFLLAGSPGGKRQSGPPAVITNWALARDPQSSGLVGPRQRQAVG